MSRVFACLVLLFSFVCLGCRPSEKDAIKEGAKLTKPVLPAADSSLTETELEAPTAKSAKGDAAINWTQFRGPSMLGVNTSATVPIEWNNDQGVVWKTDIIEDVKTRGSSSPVVFGDRVYLTAFSGCGTSNQDRENISALKHHVICFDKYSGKRIWQRTIQGSNAIKRLSEHAMGHGYASSTPETPKNVYSLFPSISGVLDAYP